MGWTVLQGLQRADPWVGGPLSLSRAVGVPQQEEEEVLMGVDLCWKNSTNSTGMTFFGWTRGEVRSKNE